MNYLVKVLFLDSEGGSSCHHELDDMYFRKKKLTDHDMSVKAVLKLQLHSESKNY